MNGSNELINIKNINSLIAGLIIQFCRVINNIGRILIKIWIQIFWINFLFLVVSYASMNRHRYRQRKAKTASTILTCKSTCFYSRVRYPSTFPLTNISTNWLIWLCPLSPDISVSQLSVPALNTLKVKQSQGHTMRRDCSYYKQAIPCFPFFVKSCKISTVTCYSLNESISRNWMVCVSVLSYVYITVYITFTQLY